MRRLFSLLTLCCMIISMAWADSESVYVYRNDNDFNYFVVDRLDSVVYSNIDMAGKQCAIPMVQEFWTGGKVTRIPLDAIDSIRFVTPEENLGIVDPIRYKKADADAKINPNILMDTYQSTELVSLDTLTWMAKVRFNEEVPNLYKGAIMIIPVESSFCALRVLEAYQDGIEAEVHVIPASVQEMFFNLNLSLGEDDNSTNTARAKAQSGDNPLMVEFCKTDLVKKFSIGLDFGIDEFKWDSKLKFDLKIDGPRYTDGGLILATIEKFYFRLKGDFSTDLHISFSPKGEVGTKVSWDWTDTPIPLELKIPIPGVPIPLVTNFAITLSAEMEATVKAGNFTWYQPYTLSADAQVGLDYTESEGGKSLNDFNLHFIKKKATLEHTPDMEVKFAVAPVYPKFKVYFYRIRWAGYDMEVKPSFTYNARSLVLDGQEHFQQKIEADITTKVGLYQEVTTKIPKALAVKGPKFGPWRVWSEPAKLEKLDSVRNVFLHQKSKVKQPVRVKGEEINNVSTSKPAPKPEPTALNNPVKVEIRTKSPLMNPKDKAADKVLGDPTYKGDYIDANGLYDWANEYQEVDTETGTFKPIYKGYTPAGVETKQLIRITDPETGEVIDSTEIVPITTIKSYDTKMTMIHNDSTQKEYVTLKADIQVREFGATVHEKTHSHTLFYCSDCECWHTTDGDYVANYKDQEGKTVYDGEMWEYTESGAHIKKNIHQEYDFLLETLGLSTTQIKGTASLTDTYIPVSYRLEHFQPYGQHLVTKAEGMDEAKWMIENTDFGKFDLDYEYFDAQYRGVDCTEMRTLEDSDFGVTSHFYWQNIYLAASEPAREGYFGCINTDELIIYPDTIPGQPKGDTPITVIAAGGKSVNFGDGNDPENRVYPDDKPNIPAVSNGDDDNPDDDPNGEGGGGGGLGAMEWTKTWTPGIYEMTDDEEGVTMMFAVSTDGWTYLIMDINDYEGDNLVEFDDLDYNYDGYNFHMPCGFKWCDRGSTAYYYVENPSTGKGEVKEIKFKDRETLVGYGQYGCWDIKMMGTMLKPEYMKRVAEAGDHSTTYNTILTRYSK